LYRNFLLAVVLMLGFTAISASAQDAEASRQELSATEMRTVRTAAARPLPATFFAVTQDFEGNFDNVDAAMARFEREAKAQDIPNANPTGVLVLYEDPTGKSQFRMAVGVIISKRAEVKPPLKVEQMAFSEAVRVTVVGQYQKLGSAYRGTEAALRERQMQTKGARLEPVKDTSAPFAVLRLESDPKRVRPDQRRTELIIPLTRAKQ
jgi:hypothetical protein